MSQYVPDDDDSDDVYEVDPVELCLRFGVSRAQHEQAQERVTTLRRWRQHGLTEDWVSTVLWPGARFPDLIFLVGPDHRHAVERWVQAHAHLLPQAPTLQDDTPAQLL